MYRRIYAACTTASYCLNTNDNVVVRQHKYSNWDEISEVHNKVMVYKVELYNEVITLQ